MRLLLILGFVSKKCDILMVLKKGFFKNVHNLNGGISVSTFASNFVYKGLEYSMGASFL